MDFSERFIGEDVWKKIKLKFVGINGHYPSNKTNVLFIYDKTYTTKFTEQITDSNFHYFLNITPSLDHTYHLITLIFFMCYLTYSLMKTRFLLLLINLQYN